MIWTRLLPSQQALLGWAGASLALAFLPTGTGGPVRAINAVAFLCFGPGCAVMVRLAGSWSASVCSVIAIAVSFTVLVLSSQLLLILGAWSAPGVATLVALVTIALAVAPFPSRAEADD